MKKVLILEDEVNIRSFVVINLRRAGYDAIEAATGTETAPYFLIIAGSISRIFSLTQLV